MTNAFEDLERSLPNGFHDAELLSLHVDYADGQATVELNVDTGDSEGLADTVEVYRRARVRFLGLKLFAVDPPGTAGPFVISTVAAGSGDPPTAKVEPHLPADCFLVWFFLTSFNSFVRIAAKDVHLEWVDGKPLSSHGG